MNDTELDRLLATWGAPAAPRGMRERLLARLPRAERRSVRRPLRWLVATGVAFAALSLAMGQGGTSWGDSRVAQAVVALWDHVADAFYMHRIGATMGEILNSDPHVFVDGNAAPALERGHALTLLVQVPGDGAYRVTLASKPMEGWTRTGQIKGSYLEFEAGSHHVVIMCNRRLMMSDSPVLVRRQK